MLRERWNRLWRKLGAPRPPEETLAELISSYSAPERFYHNLTHVEDCLRVFDSGRDFTHHPEDVETAIWFHDAVYHTAASGNEQKSAEWAGRVIRQAGLSEEVAERVSRLILATCHDKEVTDHDAQVLVDVDLSILGREEQVFWEYERNIRKEYAWVPESLFNEKRAEILRNFLRRQRIYNVSLYRNKYEERARENIRQAIARLESLSPNAGVSTTS